MIINPSVDKYITGLTTLIILVKLKTASNAKHIHFALQIATDFFPFQTRSFLNIALWFISSCLIKILV